MHVLYVVIVYDLHVSGPLGTNNMDDVLTRGLRLGPMSWVESHHKLVHYNPRPVCHPGVRQSHHRVFLLFRDVDDRTGAPFYVKTQSQAKNW